MLLVSMITAFSALLLWAAFSDLATMQIPNRISILIAALFLPAAAVAGLGPAAVGVHLAFGAGALIICAGLFYLGVFGGGDAKLIAAIALWTGPTAIAPFLFWTALAGGVLAGTLIVLRRMKLATQQAWSTRLLSSQEGAPYAVAISAGAFIAAPAIPVIAAAL
ncbi:hypothetical protein GC169_01350 [bacterium]|nr:hypothetical protein [bacterium]